MPDGSDYINKIKYLERFISINESLKLGIALVESQKLSLIFEMIPREVLLQVVEKIQKGDLAPAINSDGFIDWMIRKRELSGLSQSDLAREIGVRPEQINRFEKGTHPLKSEHLEKIRERFNI